MIFETFFVIYFLVVGREERQQFQLAQTGLPFSATETFEVRTLSTRLPAESFDSCAPIKLYLAASPVRVIYASR